MGKLLVLFILLPCTFNNIFAQNPVADSLKQLRLTTKEDTVQVQLTLRLANQKNAS